MCGISLYRLQNGPVQEIWERFDMMEFLEQLGALDPRVGPVQVTD